MRYITEYEACALIFLLIVTFRFCSMRKFNSKSNRLFGVILYFALVVIILDIVGSYTVLYADIVPLWLNYTVNTVFYMLQLGTPGLFLLYVFILSGREIPRPAYILFVPLALFELVLLSNPFTHLIFYFERTAEGISYNHGGLFIALYVTGGLYVLIALATVLVLRRCFRKIEIRAVLFFVSVILVSMVIQSFFPSVLLTGVSISIAIFTMFLTFQNPETMLDSISGTFNYTALADYLRKLINERRAVWIMAVDVGGIRRVNSVMGIRAGNELLEQVGAYINSMSNSHSTAFHMIGTRFVVISDTPEAHNSFIKAVTDRFQHPWHSSKSGIMLIATVRYLEQARKFSSPEDVLSLIDLAYFNAAEEGYGTTIAIDPTQLACFERNDMIREALTRAVSTGEGFTLNYQPIYSLADGKFTSAEALLRFYDSELGNVSPAEFIPVAESTGLICKIDALVVKMACDFIKSHPELFNSGLHLLEINLSAAEFNNGTDKLLADISDSIESIEDRICFEVTETAVTSRRDNLQSFMDTLIDRGVRFAIDDFGVGYANLTRLSKLPFSIVKLDRVFVSHNTDRESSIIKSLIGMFDGIGLTTVFEGIETADQLKFASELGVRQIQGYHFSRPLSPEAFIDFILSNNK